MSRKSVGRKLVSRKLANIFVFGVTTLGLLGLSGCTMSDTAQLETDASKSNSQPAADASRLPALRLANRSIVPISSLTAEKVDETVTISGRVIRREPILAGWLYQIEDDTGELWVLSNQSNSAVEPEADQIAIVEGIVRYEPIVVEEIDASELYLEAQTYETQAD
ncbi:MAG: hypothetical protein WBD47_17190 [Phormidesmis sp.]